MGYIGYANNIRISGNITNSVSVTGTNHVGGIFGGMNSACDLGNYNFTNTGSIKGASYVGGIFGDVPGISSTSLHNLTNNGQIIGSTSYVGGLIGKNSVVITG